MLAIPDWKSFVLDCNKSNCLNYMGESCTSKHTLLPAGFTLILRGVLRDPGYTVQLSVDRAFELSELSCEKHDTGFFAHMAYSITHHHHRHALIIVANDTDIFMMFVYFITQLDDLHDLRVKKMTNYSPVHAITDDLAVKYAVSTDDGKGVPTKLLLIACKTFNP